MSNRELDIEMRPHLLRSIALYERQVKRGIDVSILHEELVDEVANCYGVAVAEYFDRHRRLPLRTHILLPWPVSDSASLAITLVCVSIVVIWLPLGLRLLPSGEWPILPVWVPGSAVTIFAIKLIAKLKIFEPKDIVQRRANAAEYLEIVQRTKAERVQLREFESQAARESRQKRLEGGE